MKATIYYTTDGTDPVVPGDESSGVDGAAAVASATQRRAPPKQWAAAMLDPRRCHGPQRPRRGQGRRVREVPRRRASVIGRSDAPRPSSASPPRRRPPWRITPRRTPTARGSKPQPASDAEEERDGRSASSSGLLAGGDEVDATTANAEEDSTLLETYTSRVDFSFACQTPGAAVHYVFIVSAADEIGLEPGPGKPGDHAVAQGQNVAWTRLGTVTVRARAYKDGMIESPEATRRFVVVEPLYDQHPLPTVASESLPPSRRSGGGAGGEEALLWHRGVGAADAHESLLVDPSPESSFWQDDPVTPSLNLRHFARPYKSSGGSSGGSSEYFVGRMAKVRNPRRFLSVVSPACGKLELATATAAAYPAFSSSGGGDGGRDEEAEAGGGRVRTREGASDSTAGGGPCGAGGRPVAGSVRC